MPVLMLAGENDATLAAGYRERLADRIGPTARLVAVSGAGHTVMLTHADTVSTALLDPLAASEAATDERRTS